MCRQSYISEKRKENFWSSKRLNRQIDLRPLDKFDFARNRFAWQVQPLNRMTEPKSIK
jgi:hypothetical protein